MDTFNPIYMYIYIYWLVVWNIFPHTLGIIIPTDELIFVCRWVGMVHQADFVPHGIPRPRPPTSSPSLPASAPARSAAAGCRSWSSFGTCATPGVWKTATLNYRRVFTSQEFPMDYSSIPPMILENSKSP